MIRKHGAVFGGYYGKPRASGDDPDLWPIIEQVMQ